MKKIGKFFVFVFLGLFLLSIFASVALAADPALVVGTAPATTNTPAATAPASTGFLAGLSKMKNDLFGSSGLGQYQGIVSKILLIILITLLVYSLASFLPFFPTDPRKDYIKWLFALVFAVLAFIYVSEGDIQAILTTYQGAGIMLATVIPLVILITFTTQLIKDHPEYKFVNTLVMGGFIIYVTISWLISGVSTYGTSQSSWLYVIYPLTLAAAILWFFFGNRVMSWINRKRLEGDVDSAKEAYLNNLYAQYEERLAQKEHATPEVAKRLDREIVELSKKIRTAGGKIALS